MSKKKPCGRFGSRYGKSIRESVMATDKKAKANYKCPSCSRITIKRVASGIWQCKKCKTKFASTAYEFKV